MKSKGAKIAMRGKPGAALAATFGLALAFAPGVSVASPSSKKVIEICAKSTDAAFRAKYCTAAKDLKHGQNANVASSAVWSGVSVACGVACGKAIGGIACQVAGYSGTAGEGVITKKFTDALAGEGMSWGGQALAGKKDAAPVAGAGTTADAAAGAGGKVNGDACAAAGKSALKAYEKFSNSKQNDRQLTELREQTKDMNTPVTQSQVAYQTGDTQTTGDRNGTSGAAASAGKTEPCEDAAIKTALGAIRCAASADPSLPPYVKSEEFLKDLQKATGRSPDAFFAGFESPAKAVFDSPLAAGLTEDQQNKLADALSAMEGYSEAKAAKLAAASPGAEGYRGARGGSAADDDTGFDMNGMIAGVLGQLGAGEDGASGAGGSPDGKMSADRRPAGNVNAAEDRKISIFDRVQWRYGSVSARDRLGVQ